MGIKIRGCDCDGNGMCVSYLLAWREGGRFVGCFLFVCCSLF